MKKQDSWVSKRYTHAITENDEYFISHRITVRVMSSVKIVFKLPSWLSRYDERDVTRYAEQHQPRSWSRNRARLNQVPGTRWNLCWVSMRICGYGCYATYGTSRNVSIEREREKEGKVCTITWGLVSNGSEEEFLSLALLGDWIRSRWDDTIAVTTAIMAIENDRYLQFLAIQLPCENFFLF